MITSLWLHVARPWELQSQTHEPGVADLPLNKSQETGVQTVLHPLKPSPCTAPPAIPPPYPVPPPLPPLYPQPDTPSQLFPAHRATVPRTESSCRRCSLPTLRETRAGSHTAAAGCSDSPTVARLALLLGCLNVPVTDASSRPRLFPFF